jgi:hypothetical protein
MARTTAGALACRVENFLQDRAVLDRAVDNLSTMRWRAVVRAGEDESPDAVCNGEISYVEMHYPPKHVCRPTPDVIVHMGNHHVDLAAGEIAVTDQVVLLHAPVRCRSMLVQRADAGRRIAATNPDPRISWHLRRIAELDEAGRLEEEWRACSVLDGALDVGDRRHDVVPDDRLVRAVAPYLQRELDRGLDRGVGRGLGVRRRWRRSRAERDLR